MPLPGALHLAATCITNHGILPGLYDNITCTDAGVPTISSVQDVFFVVGNVARILIAISGAIAMVVIIVAAIYYITSAGDPGRVKQAKEILISMSVGLMLISSAYAILTFIAGGF